MNMNNIFLNTDSYKPSHSFMYPMNTSKVYSYIESRGGDMPVTLFMGIQMFNMWLKSVFPTMEDVNEARDFYAEHGEPFNYEGAKQLVELGYFPLEIKAVKEGTVLPTKNILLSITNTHPDFPWLPSYLETALLNKIWYPTTVASYSYACKQIIKRFYDETVDESSFGGLSFALHDFGFRGASSIETAGIGAVAHLVNFLGSDTVIGNAYAKKFYNCRMAGFSVPAAEHSTIVSWGKENEKDAYEHILDTFPTGNVSIVPDSYDIYNAVDRIFGIELKEKVLARDGTTVIRPDSGVPVDVLMGDIESTDPLANQGIIELLWNRFGGRINDKGYRVLNDKVRVLQGDGINIKSLEEILERAKELGWSAENFIFGMGGKLLQDHNRDTQKFACKCSYVEVDGVGRDVFKDPKTDPGKTSKKGIMSLVKDGDTYTTVQGEHPDDLLETVFLNGEITRFQTLDEIRSIAR